MSVSAYPETPPRARPWRLLVLVCLALAALSLLGPHSPTYDPWAWLIWGREIIHLDLSTSAGPSWKPLPVAFTTVFALFGSGPAPLLWLLVARAGGLLAVVLAFRLAARVAGPLAGVLAAAALLLTKQLVSITARGTSEGLLVALGLWAVERHLDGRRRDAFLLAAACGLLRPEVWPFIALYGLWLIREAWRDAPPWPTIALVAGSGAVVALAWFVPEYLGSGDLLRAADRALVPVADSPAQSDHPFLSVFTNSASALPWPVYAGAGIAVLLALWEYRRTRRGTVVLALAVISTVLMITVAVLAEIGFTGNLRYVMLPASIVCVLGGIGWAQLVLAVRRRFGTVAMAVLAVVAIAVSVPALSSSWSTFEAGLRQVRDEGRQSQQLPVLIERAGGRDAVLRCGQVYTGAFQTQVVAWYLRVHEEEVGLRPNPPGSLIAPRDIRLSRDARFPLRVSTSLWVLRSTCPLG
jgi:hypothetical protein